jgi:hypothetical protein
METSLDSIQKVLDENKIDTLAGLRIAANAVETRIKNYYFSDTIDVELGKKMDRYKQIRKAIDTESEEGETGEEEEGEAKFQTIGKGFSMISQGIKAERKSLSQLKSDIENGYGKRDKYNEYVSFEQEKVRQLHVLLDEYVKLKVETTKAFNEIHQDLLDFSMEQYRKNKDKKMVRR